MRRPDLPWMPRSHAATCAALVARRAAKCIEQKNNAGATARVIEINPSEAQPPRPARPRPCPATGTRTATVAGAARTGAEHRLRLHRQQAFALQLLAGQLAGAT